jgi:hypothetical protein
MSPLTRTISPEAYAATDRAIDMTDDPRRLGGLAESLEDAYDTDPRAHVLLERITRKLARLRGE